jgi:hypothetical protein
MSVPAIDALKTPRRFEPLVSDMHLCHVEDQRPSSFDMYMGLKAPQMPENL